MSESPYRAGLPPIPARLLHRPIERGYPVPWFCEQIDGHWDFRIVDGRKFKPAIQQQLCWICGQKLGGYKAFVLGPMCAINRTIGDPPSHRDCAHFAAQACPFLNQTEKRRNTANLPPEGRFSEFGIPRQAGVSLLWVTKSFQYFRAPDNTLLFTVGEPTTIAWFREGRAATRDEVMESITSGLPILMEIAEQDGPAAVAELEAARERAMRLVPE